MTKTQNETPDLSTIAVGDTLRIAPYGKRAYKMEVRDITVCSGGSLILMGRKVWRSRQDGLKVIDRRDSVECLTSASRWWAKVDAL